MRKMADSRIRPDSGHRYGGTITVSSRRAPGRRAARIQSLGRCRKLTVTLDTDIRLLGCAYAGRNLAAQVLLRRKSSGNIRLVNQRLPTLHAPAIGTRLSTSWDSWDLVRTRRGPSLQAAARKPTRKVLYAFSVVEQIINANSSGYFLPVPLWLHKSVDDGGVRCHWLSEYHCGDLD
jgi:hypothetical protein